MSDLHACNIAHRNRREAAAKAAGQTLRVHAVKKDGTPYRDPVSRELFDAAGAAVEVERLQALNPHRRFTAVEG